MMEENNTKGGEMPAFNQSLAYHARLHTLFMLFHESMLSNKSLLTALNVLEQVQLELWPRIIGAGKDVNILVQLRNGACQAISDPNPSPESINKKMNALRAWFFQLNNYAHELGLILADKISDTRAGEL